MRRFAIDAFARAEKQQNGLIVPIQCNVLLSITAFRLVVGCSSYNPLLDDAIDVSPASAFTSEARDLVKVMHPAADL